MITFKKIKYNVPDIITINGTSIDLKMADEFNQTRIVSRKGEAARIYLQLLGYDAQVLPVTGGTLHLTETKSKGIDLLNSNKTKVNKFKIKGKTPPKHLKDFMDMFVDGQTHSVSEFGKCGGGVLTNREFVDVRTLR